MTKKIFSKESHRSLIYSNGQKIPFFMVLFFLKNEYLQIMFNFNDSNYEESDSIVFGSSILYRIADVCPSLCFRESS